MANRAFLVDVSHWNEVDFAVLKANGVDCAVVKATQGRHLTDPKLQHHASEAVNAGMLLGVYHWCDPTNDDQQQTEHFLRAIAGLNLHFVALDLEQHWQSWEEWRKRSITKIIPPDRISECAHTIANKVSKTLDVPVVIYTRRTFINEFAHPMLDWLAQFPLWLAEYPYPPGRLETSWDNFKTHHLPTYAGPALPQGCTQWHIWQFTGDRFVLPGSSGGPIDINFFNGSPEDLMAFAPGPADIPPVTEPAPPAAEPPPLPSGGLRARVLPQVLNVRNGPGLDFQDIGDLAQGDVISILNIAGEEVWVKIETDKWTAFRYEGFQFMNLEPPTPPGASARARVSTPVLNIRNGPGVVDFADIGDLVAGDLVDILDLAGYEVWVEFEPGRWTAYKYHGNQLLVLE